MGARQSVGGVGELGLLHGVEEGLGLGVVDVADLGPLVTPTLAAERTGRRGGRGRTCPGQEVVRGGPVLLLDCSASLSIWRRMPSSMPLGWGMISLVSGGSSSVPRGKMMTPLCSVVFTAAGFEVGGGDGGVGFGMLGSGLRLPGGPATEPAVVVVFAAARVGGTNTMRAWGLAMAVSSRNSSTLPRPRW
jgi:hypothetical protein